MFPPSDLQVSPERGDWGCNSNNSNSNGNGKNSNNSNNSNNDDNDNDVSSYCPLDPTNI